MAYWKLNSNDDSFNGIFPCNYYVDCLVMPMKQENCSLCPNTKCFESTSNKGEVRVEINPVRNVIRNVTEGTIKECPIKKFIEKDKEEYDDIQLY